jgi:hypothetical protein
MYPRVTSLRIEMALATSTSNDFWLARPRCEYSECRAHTTQPKMQSTGCVRVAILMRYVQYSTVRFSSISELSKVKFVIDLGEI